LTRPVATLAISLLAAACAGRVGHELPPDHVIGADARHGVAVGTIGARPDMQAMPPWYEWSLYNYRSVDDPDVQGSISSAFKWNPYYMWGSMPLCADDGLEQECGRVFALLLPTGEYEFTGVAPAMMDEATSSGLDTDSWLEPLSGYRFSVRPGEVVYIGNLLSRICVAGTGRGNAPWSAVGDVADRADRDIPLVMARYPALQGQAVARRTMTGEPWLWRHSRLKSANWPKGCSIDAQERARYLREFDRPLGEPDAADANTCKDVCAHHQSSCAVAGATCDVNAENTCIDACMASARAKHGGS